MDKLKYIRVQQENKQYNGNIPIGVDSQNVDLNNGNNLQDTIGDYDYTKQGNFTEKFNTIEKYIEEQSETIKGQSEIISAEANIRASTDSSLLNQITSLQGAVGSPLLATLSKEMTDTTKIYVYVGNESNYINGNWYYYNINTSDWTSGGVYNSTAINTDSTLSVSNMAADAKITGDLFKNSNFNQRVKINPFVTTSAYTFGCARGNRATLNILDNKIKIIRNSTSPTTNSYGCFFIVEPTAQGNNNNHKIYIKISGLDHSEAINYSRWGIFGSSGSITSGFSGINFTSSDYENIFTLKGNAGIFNILLRSSTAAAAGEYFTLDYVQWIDLTEIFGAGYEPTLEQFKAIYNNFPYNFRYSEITSDSREIKILHNKLEDIAFTSMTSLPNGQDLDELIIPGIYMKYDAYSWYNYPEDLENYSSGLILVLSGQKKSTLKNLERPNFLIQIFISTNFFFWRYRSAAQGWRIWQRIATKAQNFSYQRVINQYYINFTYLLEQAKRSWKPTNSNMINIKNISTTPGTPTEYEYFNPEETYNHIPYSGMLQVGGDVFHDRNLITFFSAVENPASILYQEQISKGRYQGANYGAICTSLSGWLLGEDIYRSTSELPHYLNFYDYHDPEDVQVGDVLLTLTPSGHIMIIVGIEIDPINFTVQNFIIADQASTRTRRFSVKDFENLLSQEQFNWRIGKYPNAKIRKIEPIRYATDVIANMGNNTYYYKNDKVWLYIPKGDVLYYKQEDDENYTSISLNSLSSRTTNEVIEYDVTDLMENCGKYYFSTDPQKYNQKCELLRVDPGEIQINDNVITISNYSDNLEPLYYQIMRISRGTSDSSIYPAPENCIANRVANSQTYITENSFTIIKPTSSTTIGFYIRVYYKNEFGKAYKDSEYIMY